MNMGFGFGKEKSRIITLYYSFILLTDTVVNFL